MSTSPSPAPSPLISKQEYYSSLPWFRRCLAMLNWRPVVDYELREIEFDRKDIEYEQRMQQLQSETEQLRSENARLAELNSKIDALLFSSSTSSTPPQTTQDNSEG